jgi:hypothetical protein
VGTALRGRDRCAGTRRCRSQGSSWLTPRAADADLLGHAEPDARGECVGRVEASKGAKRRYLLCQCVVTATRSRHNFRAAFLSTRCAKGRTPMASGAGIRCNGTAAR